MNNTYVALDIETSGINPSEDRIIEIGMAKIIDGQIVDTYSKLINPGIMVSDRITQLTGISNDMLAGKPRIEDIIAEVVAYSDGYIIMGHNVVFDYSFIKKAAVNNRISFERQAIDTLKIARKILPDVPKKNLEYLCEYFSINPGNSHRALDDAISSHKLYNILYNIKPDDDLFENPIQMVYSVKKDSPITQAQARYLNDLIKKHNLSVDVDINNLTKSKASKMIDGIILQYGK